MSILDDLLRAFGPEAIASAIAGGRDPNMVFGDMNAMPTLTAPRPGPGDLAPPVPGGDLGAFLGLPNAPPVPMARPAAPPAPMPQAPPQPRPDPIAIGSRRPMPGAGVAGGGPNPIMAGSRILPFTPEEVEQAMSIGAPSFGGGGGPVPGLPGAGAGPAPAGAGEGGLGGLGGFLPILGDIMVGVGTGDYAGVGKNIAARSQARSARAQDNRTRQLAVQLGIPEQIAVGLPAKDLVPIIRDRMRGAPPPSVETVYDDQGREQKVLLYPDGSTKNLGGSKASEGLKPTDDMREYDLYVQQEKAAGREPKSFSAYLIMMKEAGRSQIDINTGEKLPSGYRWKDPDRKELGVEPIPGGPATAIPAELAARVGMADSFLGQAPEIRRRLAAGEITGPIDRFQAGNNQSSAQAEVMRQMKSGTDALQRMLTGAGMPASEAAQYAERYLPTYTDNAESAANKLDQLVRELERVKAMAMRGRGGETPPVPDDAGGWTDLGNGVRMRQVK